ncbi:MAG: hypothetical protein H7A37_07615 [Chlamydiales bacterium]|nr:hypothetical protein [Chlamydiales bacterium]
MSMTTFDRVRDSSILAVTSSEGAKKLWDSRVHGGKSEPLDAISKRILDTADVLFTEPCYRELPVSEMCDFAALFLNNPHCDCNTYHGQFELTAIAIGALGFKAYNNSEPLHTEQKQRIQQAIAHYMTFTDVEENKKNWHQLSLHAPLLQACSLEIKVRDTLFQKINEISSDDVAEAMHCFFDSLPPVSGFHSLVDNRYKNRPPTFTYGFDEAHTKINMHIAAFMHDKKELSEQDQTKLQSAIDSFIAKCQSTADAQQKRDAVTTANEALTTAIQALNESETQKNQIDSTYHDHFKEIMPLLLRTSDLYPHIENMEDSVAKMIMSIKTGYEDYCSSLEMKPEEGDNRTVLRANVASCEAELKQAEQDLKGVKEPISEKFNAQITEHYCILRNNLPVFFDVMKEYFTVVGKIPKEPQGFFNRFSR